MPVRPVITGKTADVTRVYITKDGLLKPVSKIYLPNETGKTALYWSKKGTRTNPYVIRKMADLKKIREDPAGHFRLERGLVVGREDYEEYFPFLPPDVPFTGTLDGNKQTINLYASHPSYLIPFQGSSDGFYSALFCKNAGTISKLNVFVLTSMKASTGAEEGAYAGLIAGLNEGVIDQCCVNLWVESDKAAFGCAVGFNKGSMSNIEASFRNGAGHPRAGLAVVNEGTIQKCVSGASQDNTGERQSVQLVYDNRESGRLISCFYRSYSNLFAFHTDVGYTEKCYRLSHPYNIPSKYPGLDFDNIWAVRRSPDYMAYLKFANPNAV